MKEMRLATVKLGELTLKQGRSTVAVSGTIGKRLPQ